MKCPTCDAVELIECMYCMQDVCPSCDYEHWLGVNNGMGKYIVVKFVLNRIEVTLAF